MSRPIVQARARSAQIRQTLREAPLVALRELLPDQAILDACEACGHRYRDRRYGPVVTTLHFLAQALSREHSFAANWQALFTPLAAAFPDLDLGPAQPSGLAHARARLPIAVLRLLAQQACQRTADYAPPRWQGLTLYALDCSVLTMPDTQLLHDHFKTLRLKDGRQARYPLGTLATLLQLDTGLLRDGRFGPYDPGEFKTAGPLLEHLGTGDLLLADRHYAGAPFLGRLQGRACHWLMRKHQRLNPAKLPVRKRLGQNDFLTDLPISKSARAKDPTLPATVRVRLFKATWTSPAGEKLTEWFVTSLTCPARFKKSALARLYHERWRIETSYLDFKQTLGALVLRSKTPGNVLKEVAAHVLAYQLVRVLMVAAADQDGAQRPTALSFLNAVRWVDHFSQRMAAAPAWKLPLLFERLLECIVTTAIDIRPGRLEPRLLSRDPRRYPMRRVSRTAWRQQRLRRTG
jgi:hypothetical protein